MATMNISLPDPMRAFIEAEVAEGGYSTASEYFRELVRTAQKQKAETTLQSLLLEGLQSGDAAELTPEDWSDLRRRVGERLAHRTE
jgi:antitoxin ParD1/3/4